MGPFKGQKYDKERWLDLGVNTVAGRTDTRRRKLPVFLRVEAQRANVRWVLAYDQVRRCPSGLNRTPILIPTALSRRAEQAEGSWQGS